MSGTMTGRPAGTDEHTGSGEPPARAGVSRWAADLAMGARFALTGGRESWARTLLTAIGVGLGVALLLAASAVPTMMAARDARGDARSIESSMVNDELKPGPKTLRIGQADTTYHGKDVRGLVMSPDGAKPPVPPGLSAIPRPGEMVVSPALAELLASPEGKLLKERLGDRVTGTIGDEGLIGPNELAFYAGAAPESFGKGHSARLDHFGATTKSDPLPPELLLLVIIACVVLLLPVAIFIATAVRFGSERRDRRLAALRLVGADGRMARRIAAGEALLASLAGLAVGCGVFLAGRQFVNSVTLFDVSVFPSDVTPSPALATLIAVAVPACAVAVTLFALRGVTIEPLGVVRNAATRRRRLWWRLALPALGLGLLYPLMGGGFGRAGDREIYQVAAGAVLVLIGVTAVLPWLVEAVVNRFGGGPLPWQLATRRLQLSSGTASRTVSGITIAVAGAIAIQMLFASAEDSSTKATGQDASRAQAQVSIEVTSGAEARDVLGKFRGTEGVREVFGLTEAYVSDAESKARKAEDVRSDTLTIGGCATLRELLRIGACKDGDVFVTKPEPDYGFAAPGRTVDLNLTEEGLPAGRPKPWTIPASARVVDSRPDPIGWERTGIFATPSALDVSRLSNADVVSLLKLDPRKPDAVEHVRNTTAAISPTVDVLTLQDTQVSNEFDSIRRGLFIGATATLLLIGASMIVTMLEQLRERKRLLSVLVAFGTRRTTIGWSVFWQTAVPVVLGLALSVAGGLALGAVLLEMVDQPVAIDWSSLGTMTGTGAAVILLVTLVSLPPLWRMMRPDGLRTE
ncbi:FtsX-like permease family protein [Streptomyces sp. 7N604]|uniref:FtsX-like permease family protein n=1 Tax=Streptomyces sp. 7N604 TaxID=3457415 RepID=UPI003FD2644B